MRWVLPAALCAVLTGCGAIDNFTRELKSWRLDTQETRDFLNKVSAKASELSTKVDQLDRDKDGKVTLEELLAGLFGLGGAGGILTLVRNGKSNERKTKLEERLASLERGGTRGPGV